MTATEFMRHLTHLRSVGLLLILCPDGSAQFVTTE